MDSSTRLDYILFHLTPTRTRCDLVIFAGKSSEKIAYGLLEPFVVHLRLVKDQILKGGYSVTLRPPSSVFSPWFTKATLQRFVRFVSTPEVLERFVTIEREIEQLENSIKSYEASNADGGHVAETEGNETAVRGNSRNSTPVKSKDESSCSTDHLQEENSTVRLQRVVHTRKAVLQKEQAMVYARALAAGFEMDNLADLLLFSDAFGASRLKEACINFKDLCQKKNEDRIWVDEIAAIQAIVQPDLSFMGTSGIVLAEDNDPTRNVSMVGKQNGSTDLSMPDTITSHGSPDAGQDTGSTQPKDPKAQIPNPWTNQFAPYLHNFQGPVYNPQMPPYHGYTFPGMKLASPYYPPNMQWSMNADRDLLDHHGHQKTSRKKDKRYKSRENERDRSSEHSGSTSETETETETDSSSERSHRKKHGKKSSRKVVIQNINYITSKKDGEKNGTSEMVASDEDGYLDGDSLKQQLENVVGSFEKHDKSSSRHHRKREGSKHLTSFGSNDQDNDDISVKNKGNENWDAFQHLLLEEKSEYNNPEAHSVEEEYHANTRFDERKSHALKLEADERAKQRPGATDAFLITKKCTGYDGSVAKLSIEDFDNSESFSSSMKRGTTEELMIAQRTEEPECHTRLALSDDTVRSSVIRSQESDEWFISKQSNEAVNHDTKDGLRLINGDYVTSMDGKVEKKKKDVIIDDSLMIQGRLTDDNPETQIMTDFSLVSDILKASIVENSASEAPNKEHESLGYFEPDELYMVLDRDTIEEPVPSWTPEMDYENTISVNNFVKNLSDVDNNNDTNLTSKDKDPKKEKSGASVVKARDPRSRSLNGPLRKGKPDPTPANRRSTFGSKTSPKSHLEKKQEEERRKRMEELLLQRQKRIAEKSNLASSRKPQIGSKSSSQDPKKPKAVFRSSTIERLATAKTIPDDSLTLPRKVSSRV